MREAKFWNKHLKNRTYEELNQRMNESLEKIKELQANKDRLHDKGIDSLVWEKHKQYPKEINKELNQIDVIQKELEEEINDIWAFLHLKKDKKRRNDLYC